MEGMERDTIGGFNAMLEKQKAQEGEVFVTTILFANHTETLHDRIPLQEVKPLTLADYEVGGCTALLDAIGEAVERITTIHKYARKEDIPQHTMFIITTDGMENASTSYTSRKIKTLIKAKEKLGWEFLFLAANIDAVATAESLGIHEEHAANYCVEEETEGLYEGISEAVCHLRTYGCLPTNCAEKVVKNRRKGK